MRPNSAPDLLSFTVRSIPRSSHLASKLNLRLQNRCSQTSGWHHGSIISSVSELNQQLKHITRTYHEMLRFCSLFSKLFFFFCPSKQKVEPRSYSFSDSHRVLPFWPPVTSGESKLMGFCSASSWKFSPNLKKMQQMCLDLSRPNEVTQLDKRFKTLPCIW